MFFNTWYDVWHKGDKEREESKRIAAQQKEDAKVSWEKQFNDKRREAYSKEIARVRKAVATAVAGRKHFLDIESLSVNKHDWFISDVAIFRLAIVEVANEEGSYVLNVSFHSEVHGPHGPKEIRALLKLAVAPKNRE